jgi:hypothetical protein
MGRSVDYLSRSQKVVYIPFEVENEFDSEFDSEFEWDCFYEDLINILCEKYPSLYTVKNKWDGRETRIILENDLCQIGLSEYCGLVSVSIRVNEYYEYYNIAESWINRINFEKVLNEKFNALHKIGTFSNGESIYERIN